MDTGVELGQHTMRTSRSHTLVMRINRPAEKGRSSSSPLLYAATARTSDRGGAAFATTTGAGAGARAATKADGFGAGFGAGLGAVTGAGAGAGNAARGAETAAWGLGFGGGGPPAGFPPPTLPPPNGFVLAIDADAAGAGAGVGLAGGAGAAATLFAGIKCTACTPAGTAIAMPSPPATRET